MKKIHPLTTTGIILISAGAVLLGLGYPFVTALLALMAMMLAYKEVAKFTSLYQYLTVLLAAFVIAAAAEIDTRHGALGAAVLIAAFSSIGRMMFFKTFSYTGHAWFEPLLCTVAVLLFGAAAFSGSYNWPLLIVSAVPVIFAAFMGFGILKDRRQLLDFTKGGYMIEIGQKAPDFTLPDDKGEMVSLSSFIGRDLLLIFVRGDWCPGCHMMLRTYQKEKSRFQEKNVMVLAIGPDPVGVNREMVEKLGLDFMVLSDESLSTAMRYGIQIKNYEHVMQEFKEGIPLPASFLVDREGVVRYVSRPDKVGEFLNPSLIFPILQAL